MDKIASEIRKELLRALSRGYRRTETTPVKGEMYCKGHDEAVLFVARQLGFTEQEVFRAADIDREAGS